MKRENRATVKVYFDDGASLTWSIKPGSPAALNRATLAYELIKFAESIQPKAVAPLLDTERTTKETEEEDLARVDKWGCA